MAIATSKHPAARIGLHRWPAMAAILFLAAAAVPRPMPAAEKPDPAGVEFFEKKIRPMLIKQCYSCHSVEAKKNRGDLYVDSKEGLLQGGEKGPAIVPGHPEKSLLIKAVRHTDESLRMPPRDSPSRPVIRL